MAKKPKTLAEQVAEIQARRSAAAAPTKGASQTLPTGPGPSAPSRVDRAAAPTTSGRKLYDWGDGRGRRHTVSRATARRAAQTRRDERNPLYDPATQLSGSALRSAAGDLVNLEFAPQKTALDRELQNTTTQGTALADRAAGYSAQVADHDAGLVPQVQAIGSILNQQLGANTTAASSAIDDTLAGTRERAAADAQLRGVNVPGQVEGAEAEAGQQKGILSLLSKASADEGASTTANYSNLAALSATARAQMGNEVQGQLLNRLANQQGDVRARQADVAAQEGPALTAKVGELRQQGFENLITQAGLDIKTKDIQAQTAEGQARIEEAAKTRRQRARDAAANRKLKREADAAARSGKAGEINSFGYPNSEWKSMSNAARQNAIREFNRNKTRDTTRPGSKTGTKESAKAADTRTGIDNALVDIQNDPKLQRHVKESGPRLAQILTNRGATPVVAQAAAEIARYGRLKPTTIARLKRAGVKVPNAWITPEGPYLRPGAAGPPAPGN